MFNQKDIDQLSQPELKRYAADLEHENKRLNRAGDMLEQIAALLAGGSASGSTTLQAVAALKHKALLQEVYTWLAINALKFDAGDWGQEKQVRHLREQATLATSHLMNINNIYVKPAMLTVSAGKYESTGNGSERNYKYCSDIHYTLTEAIADYFEHESYPFCFIQYGAVELTAVKAQS